VPIARRADGGLAVEGQGEVVDWGVLMRRLPADRMLAELLERGEIDNDVMARRADLLADFHAGAATGPGVDEYGSPAAVAELVRQNLAELRDFTPGGAGLRTHSAGLQCFLELRTEAFLAAHEDLLARRVAEGRIRDGHGDLHAENVCFDGDSIQVYDCIEFNTAFRCADVAADLAFLTMDLDQRGFAAFGSWLGHHYVERSGDGELPRVLRFYEVYRALVRGKIAAIVAGDPELAPDRREQKRREAMRYLQLAGAYHLQPALILLSGLPASGKSWIARRLARTHHAVWLSSDVRRRVLAGLPVTAHARHGWESGLYAPELLDQTYHSLLERAVETVESGRTALVDATFARADRRRPFVDAAVRLGRPYYVVHVTVSDDVARARLERREREPDAISDAGLDVWLRAREAFEPPTEVPDGHLVEFHSGEGSPEDAGGALIDRRIALEPD